jgi:hypothetical protein
MNRITGSSCVGLIFDGCGPITVKMQGRFFRIQFKRGPNGKVSKVLADGAECASFDSFDGFDGPNHYGNIQFDLTDDLLHRIEVDPADGLYRIEAYSGPYVVINSGVGSCPAGKFLDLYWDDHVAAYRPDLVAIEAFSINDWLSNTPIDRYTANLVELCDRTRTLGAEPVILTVPPIGGEQVTRGGSVFQDYVEASRSAARLAGVVLADANRMSESLADILSDKWHPNDAGHKIYFEAILRR